MTTNDLRLSFPLGLFCMATLSWSLVSALEQSVTPPDPRGASSVPPKKKQEDPQAPAIEPAKIEQNSPETKPGSVSDGLEDDLYWNDEAAS